MCRRLDRKWEINRLYQIAQLRSNVNLSQKTEYATRSEVVLGIVVLIISTFVGAITVPLFTNSYLAIFWGMAIGFFIGLLFIIATNYASKVFQRATVSR
jgi:hypothetical protein